MRKSHSVAEFMGDFEPPELFVDPLHGEDLTTLRGENAFDSGLRSAIREAIGPRQEDDALHFQDTDMTVDMRWLLDRYEDVTGGLSPGNPWITEHQHAPDTPLEDMVGGQNSTETDKRLARFFQSADVRIPTQPIKKPEVRSSHRGKSGWGGAAYKLQRNIKMPFETSRARSFLHELGHCTMGLMSFSRETTTTFDTNNPSIFQLDNNYNLTTAGLSHVADGETRGLILEEGVAEALGSFVNQKLNIVTAKEAANVPYELQKYLIDGNFSSSAPAAAALELIAKEIGLPFEQYLKMFVDYANTGVQNTDARQEVAESIYKGTRGKLTLAQVEGLPYPINEQASLALLWAVESALDIPDHERYSQHFFQTK